MQIPTPPTEMPFGVWPHTAMIIGLLFGWRIAVPAAILAILLSYPGLPRSAIGEPDFNSIPVLSIWWIGFVASAGIAGWARSATFRSFGRELGTVVIALGIGLIAGWLVLVLRNAVNSDTLFDRYTWIYWTSVIPDHTFGYIAVIAMAGFAGAILRGVADALVTLAGSVQLRRGVPA
jgi:hypothetical protein